MIISVACRCRPVIFQNVISPTLYFFVVLKKLLHVKGGVPSKDLLATRTATSNQRTCKLHTSSAIAKIHATCGMGSLLQRDPEARAADTDEHGDVCMKRVWSCKEIILLQSMTTTLHPGTMWHGIIKQHKHVRSTRPLTKDKKAAHVYVCYTTQ